MFLTACHLIRALFNNCRSTFPYQPFCLCKQALFSSPYARVAGVLEVEGTMADGVIEVFWLVSALLSENRGPYLNGWTVMSFLKGGNQICLVIEGFVHTYRWTLGKITLLFLLKCINLSCVRKILNMFCILILFLKQCIELYYKILIFAFHSWQKMGVSAKQRRVKNPKAFLPAYLKIECYLLNSPSTVPSNYAVIW